MGTGPRGPRIRHKRQSATVTGRVLVQDGALADDLLADAMVPALEYIPALRCETRIGALLVMLIERIWIRQKRSRPS